MNRYVYSVNIFESISFYIALLQDFAFGPSLLQDNRFLRLTE